MSSQATNNGTCRCEWSRAHDNSCKISSPHLIQQLPLYLILIIHHYSITKVRLVMQIAVLVHLCIQHGWTTWTVVKSWISVHVLVQLSWGVEFSEARVEEWRRARQPNKMTWPPTKETLMQNAVLLMSHSRILTSSSFLHFPPCSQRPNLENNHNSITLVYCLLQCLLVVYSVM